MVAVRIPESPFAGWYEGPNSTAFRPFVEQLGESAAETLLAQIEYREPIEPLTVEGSGIRGVGIPGFDQVSGKAFIAKKNHKSRDTREEKSGGRGRPSSVVLSPRIRFFPVS
jgi:hypothetical protein